MCIAIYKPEEKRISEETLKECFKNNSDGCGFAYISESYTGHRKIKIKKSMTFEGFLKQYRRAIKVQPDSPFLIHFRIKTHGEISTYNCHPFRIDNEHVFIHNGILKDVTPKGKDSDTQAFNKEVLQGLPKGWMRSEAISKLIESFISTNKIVVMNIDGDVRFYNEAAGNWKDGVWYSNTSYKPRRSYSYYRYSNTNYKCDSCGTFNWGDQRPTPVILLGEPRRLCKRCRETHDCLEINEKCYEAGLLAENDSIEQFEFDRWENPWEVSVYQH
jgi:glutamine amidotransferase